MDTGDSRQLVNNSPLGAIFACETYETRASLTKRFASPTSRRNPSCTARHLPMAAAKLAGSLLHTNLVRGESSTLTMSSPDERSPNEAPVEPPPAKRPRKKYEQDKVAKAPPRKSGEPAIKCTLQWGVAWLPEPPQKKPRKKPASKKAAKDDLQSEGEAQSADNDEKVSKVDYTISRAGVIELDDDSDSENEGYGEYDAETEEKTADQGHNEGETDDKKKPAKRKHHRLTFDQRVTIIATMRENMRNGQLPRGLMSALSKKYDIHFDSLSKLRARALDEDRNILSAALPRRRDAWKKKYDYEELAAKVMAIPPEERTSVRQVAERVGASTGVIFRMMRDGHLAIHFVDEE
jgi:hypothetical protein